MRKITEHEQNAANRQLEIMVVDEPGPGGANHSYFIEVKRGMYAVTLNFQNGPIAEAGVNGITHEALIAIILDRMRAFQGDHYACRENAIVITKLEEALMWLHKRTQNREARGVEGAPEL